MDPTQVTYTWAIEGIACSIVVFSFIKGQSNVSWTLADLLEDQPGHVAPQLEGSLHGQPHRTLREVSRPVLDAVGQVSLVPFFPYKRTDT